MKKVFYLLLILGFSFTTRAQDRVYVDDTLNIEFAKADNFLEFKKLPYYEADGFQQYRPFETNRLPLARSGNLGLPVHYFTIGLQDWTMNYHLGGYSPYLFVKDSIKYYRMSRPFTQLRYTNGSESEQLFQVFHSQNIGEGLNISFEYQRITSEGYYIQQLTNHTQFKASFNLTDRGDRFRSRGYFAVNDLEAQENGGVVLSLDENQEDNTVLLDINLRNAQNQIRSNSVGTTNEYDLIMKDSSNSWMNVSHEISWTKSYRKYKDNTTETPDFYDDYFYDNTFTGDSSFSQIVENTLKANFLNKTLNIGLRNERYHYYQNSLINEHFTSNYVLAELNGKLLNQKVFAYIEKGISGFQKNELDFNTVISFQKFKGFNTKLKLRTTQKQADYLLLNQRANHHFFRTSLKTSKASNVGLYAKQTDWKLSFELGINQFQDYIYFDTSETPRQFGPSISSFYLELNKHFAFLKHLNFANRIRFQTNSEEEIIPLPNLYSYHSLYYENIFFKNSLLFQLGVDAYFMSEYEGYRYSPSLTQFYLNNEEGSLGNNLQVDVFVNMRVNKSARIFVKMENVLSNSFSEDTYRIQDYPIPGRSFKVGLSWRMVN